MKTQIILIISLILLMGIQFQGCITEGPTNNSYKAAHTIYVDIKGTTSYSSIQEAIDNAPENYTIFLLPGHYPENIIINKTITLKGSNPITTIIDGKYSENTIIIDEDNVHIMGLTITNSSTNTNKAGIRINKNYAIINNTILKNNGCGIYSNSAKYCLVYNNTVTLSSQYGIYAFSSSNNMEIRNNSFYDNEISLRIKGSQNCKVIGNQFNNSKKGMYFCCGARSNIVYNNAFWNNSIWNADDQVGNNNWDDAVSIGNYWDDYQGIDDDGDGIGDTKYVISSYRDAYDNYPLMNPPE